MTPLQCRRIIFKKQCVAAARHYLYGGWRFSMNTKLTLRMDNSLIESAKQYSAESGKSVSKIVADLFTIIKNEKTIKKQNLTPIVQSLKGIMRDKKVSKNDYKKYL